MLKAQDTKGIQISQNSWSFVIGEAFGNCNDYSSYQSAERDLDQLVNDKQLLVVFSAGNDRDSSECSMPTRVGFFSLTRPHSAKNVLSVGAVDSLKSISTFSSAGPTKDGRLKPDVVAMGVNVRSTGPNNTALTLSGTSMSAPAATGAAALLMEKYQALNGETPKPALVKGLLMNTAQDLGNRGPDFTYGYGLLQVPAALTVIEARQYQAGKIENAPQKVTVNVPTGAAALRVMLSYTDAPGGVEATSALVNELHLKLKGPDGETRLPWYPDAANPFASAAPREKIRDTVQQVVVDKPAAGTWELEVSGVELPAGAQEYWVNWSFEPIRAANCNATISPTSVVFDEKGGTALVNVNAGNECGEWTVNGNPDWAVPGSQKPGTGTGLVKLAVAPNTAGSRAGTMTIARQTLRVRQSGVCSAAAIELGAVVNAALDSADCLTADGTYAKWYTMSLKAGQRVAISLESRAFDAYLELRDAQGALVAVSDDVGDSSNSRIPESGYYTVQTSGVYRAVATTYDTGETGAFRLSVVQGDPSPVPIKDPLAFGACPAEASARLGPDSSRNGLRGDLFPAERFTFPALVGQQVTVSIPEANFDTMVQLISPKGELLASYNDPQSSGRAEIKRIIVEEGVYRVEVTPFTPFSAGTFTLKVEGCTPK